MNHAFCSVNVTLIDYEGNRHFIQGRQGQTLRQACEMNNVSLIKDDSNGGGGAHSAVRDTYYTESLFGEGVSLDTHLLAHCDCVLATHTHTRSTFVSCDAQARRRRSRTSWCRTSGSTSSRSRTTRSSTCSNTSQRRTARPSTSSALVGSLFGASRDGDEALTPVPAALVSARAWARRSCCQRSSTVSSSQSQRRRQSRRTSTSTSTTTTTRTTSSARRLMRCTHPTTHRERRQQERERRSAAEPSSLLRLNHRHAHDGASEPLNPTPASYLRFFSRRFFSVSLRWSSSFARFLMS